LELPFDVVAANVPEDPRPGESAEDMVARLATEKARAVWTSVESTATTSENGTVAVVGADTTVVDNGRIQGKPADAADARAMLRRLSGHWHQVSTGVCVIASPDTTLVSVKSTNVRLRSLTADEIRRYVATGDPLDKAGAYAVQNQTFHPVAELKGCRANVIGLPLCVTAQLLRRVGLTVPDEWERDGPGCPCYRLGLSDVTR
jgi:septum formation protein